MDSPVHRGGTQVARSSYQTNLSHESFGKQITTLDTWVPVHTSHENLRSCSTPVTPHANGQITILDDLAQAFSRWIHGILELFPGYTMLGKLNSLQIKARDWPASSLPIHTSFYHQTLCYSLFFTVQFNFTDCCKITPRNSRVC
ncbi:hypothetical protein AVEN_29653-1 [Araneus ventricosus]|uniref:Uncharacterized protein n=1 Tax=Araneus ventricosus TaxID=182803 RepID=A0A4Y2R3Y2_ARAVE|nr:hypothetical protein AVEN_29653-1 [Araneus ventricosus]